MRDLRAFSMDEAARLTGVSESQLRSWAADGFYPPEFKSADAVYFGLFSFRDLVGLRTIKKLRDERVSRQHLQDFGKWLRKHYEAPWASLRFQVLEGKPRGLLFVDPASGKPIGSRPAGQVLMVFQLKPIAAEMETAVEHLRARRPELIGKVEQRRGVQGGRPCIAGTRFPVATIAEYVNDNAIEELKADYPFLDERDIRGAVQYIRKNPEIFKAARRRSA